MSSVKYSSKSKVHQFIFSKEVFALFLFFLFLFLRINSNYSIYLKRNLFLLTTYFIPIDSSTYSLLVYMNIRVHIHTSLKYNKVTSFLRLMLSTLLLNKSYNQPINLSIAEHFKNTKLYKIGCCFLGKIQKKMFSFIFMYNPFIASRHEPFHF